MGHGSDMFTTAADSTNFARVKDLAAASNKSKTKYTELVNSIGALSNLTTTDKDSIVAAINEVANTGKYRFRYAKIIYSVKSYIINSNFSNLESLAGSLEDIAFWVDTLEGAEGTIFENVPLNSIATAHNGTFEFSTPEILTCYIILNGLIDANTYGIYYVNYSGAFIKMSDSSEVTNKKVLYVFDAGYGDTLPTTAKRGSKFLKQEEGYTVVYTAIADNTWDSGFRLYNYVTNPSSNWRGARYINFAGDTYSNLICFKFYNDNFAGIEQLTNPYVNSLSRHYTGEVIGEVGTGDTYIYNGRVLVKNDGIRIRHVTDIIPRVYDTVPSTTFAPDEDNILMINSSYKRIYKNTHATKRWGSKTYEQMPETKTYLSLDDKRIYSVKDNVLNFAPLLDGEMFYYEGDKSYYIYRLATDSFEKVPTTAATLTATLK